jgi:hypothetical protein
LRVHVVDPRGDFGQLPWVVVTGGRVTDVVGAEAAGVAAMLVAARWTTTTDADVGADGGTGEVEVLSGCADAITFINTSDALALNPAATTRPPVAAWRRLRPLVALSDR